jgi:hypothetical protein
MTWSTIKDKELTDLRQQVDTLEAMLAHASATIGRLECQWRAPGAAKEGQIALIVRQGSLDRVIGRCLNSRGDWVGSDCSEVPILTWCELPPIPADDSYADLK